MRIVFLSLLLFPPLRAAVVDYLVSAAWVVPMDAARTVLRDGAIAIKAERIVDVGPLGTLLKRHQARRTIDLGDSILVPGLINTHGHAPMVLFRGIADDRRLQDWLENYIFPAEARNVSPEFVRAGTLLACLEMLRGGTTTYTDMYYFEEVIAEATREAGMRGVLGQTIIGFPVADAKSPEEALLRSEKFLRRFQNDSLIVPAVAPHALYTSSEETLRAARALANRYAAPLLIHLSETKLEQENAVAKWSRPPAKILSDWGVLNGRTLAAHGVWLDENDLRILKAAGTGIAHCPSSNMKLSSGAAPVARMLALGIPVGLGTDGVAGSNNDLDLLEEIDLAAKLAKLTTNDPQALPAAQVFAMATIEGAKALGMDGEIGSLETGKKADWVAISLSSAGAVPMYDVYSHLAYSAKAADVTHVMVDGKLVVADRHVLTLDADRIRRDAKAWAAKIKASLRPR